MASISATTHRMAPVGVHPNQTIKQAATWVNNLKHSASQRLEGSSVATSVRSARPQRQRCALNSSLVEPGEPAACASVITPTQWVQKTVTLPAYPRGCHVITRKIYEAMPELATFEVGLAQIFILHTSASLTINENADPDVPKDLNDALNRLAPEGPHYRHADEGPDDMPAHVKSSLMGASLMLPVARGRFALGTWQGVYLNEHRNMGGPRSLVITLQGQVRADGRKYAPAWHV